MPAAASVQTRPRARWSASPAVSVPAGAPRRPCWFPPVFLAPGAASGWCPSSLSPLLFSTSPSPVAPLCRHSSLQRPSTLALLHADTLPAGSPSRWHQSAPAPCPAGAPPCVRPSLVVPLLTGASRRWCAFLAFPFPCFAHILWRSYLVVRLGAVHGWIPPPCWHPFPLAPLAGGSSPWCCPLVVAPLFGGAPPWCSP